MGDFHFCSSNRSILAQYLYFTELLGTFNNSAFYTLVHQYKQADIISQRGLFFYRISTFDTLSIPGLHFADNTSVLYLKLAKLVILNGGLFLVK